MPATNNVRGKNSVSIETLMISSSNNPAAGNQPNEQVVVQNRASTRGRTVKQPLDSRQRQNTAHNAPKSTEQRSKNQTRNQMNQTEAIVDDGDVQKMDNVEQKTSKRQKQNRGKNMMKHNSISGTNIAAATTTQQPQVSEQQAVSASNYDNQEERGAARSEPLIETAFDLTASNVQVVLELIRNSKNELFIMIRGTFLDNPTESTRVAFPFERINEALDALNNGCSVLQTSKLQEIINNARSMDSQIVNMYKMNYGYSNYFIDFKILDDADIALRITERKKMFANRNSRSYELHFDRVDVLEFHKKLANFVTLCNAHINSEQFQDVMPSLLRCEQYTLEWITRNDMTMFLKIYLPTARIILPMSMCRPIQGILHRIGDLYSEYGLDQTKYISVMQDERDRLNERRLERGLEKLADLTFRPLITESQIAANSDANVAAVNVDSQEPGEQEQSHLPKYQTLYSTRINSIENRRFYHFDIVVQTETQEVKLRIVEIQKLTPQSAANQRQNTNRSSQMFNARNNTFKHQLFVPMALFGKFIETFDKIIEQVPLPPEEAFFMNNTRCFVKFNVKRGKGLVLKIKTQQAINNNSNPPTNQPEASESGQPHQNRFGNTEIIELPVMLVYRIYKYLATNCPFVLPEQQ